MKLVLIIAASIVSNAAMAGWTAYGKIVAVMAYPDGLHVWADMPRHDPAGCGNDRYIIPNTASNIAGTTSIALAALTIKGSVRLMVDGTGCYKNNPILYAIEFRP